jgi:VanZ family protein
MDTLKQQLTSLLQYRPLWRAAFVISVLAIGFLATTDNPYPIPSSSSDKINHLVAFLELTILTRLAWPELRAIWFVPALLGFGLGIEIIQANLPYREFSLADLAADGAWTPPLAGSSQAGKTGFAKFARIFVRDFSQEREILQ